jgi:hypothetical protein
VEGYEPNDLNFAEHGDHEVTISTGPNFDSERERADDFTESLVKSNVVLEIAGPEVAAAVLAKSIKLMNLGVIGDEIADLIMPAKYKKDAKQPDPAALMQHVQEADQLLQQAQAKITQLEQQIAMDAAKEQADTERAAMNNETKKQLESLKLELQPILQEQKDRAALRLQKLKGDQAMALQNDAQVHDVALAAANADKAEKDAAAAHARSEASAEAGHERELELQDAQSEAGE